MKLWRAVCVAITYRMSHRPSISVLQLSRSSDPQTNRQTNGFQPHLYIDQTTRSGFARTIPLVFMVNLQQYRSYSCSWSTCSSIEVTGVHGQLAVISKLLVYYRSYRRSWSTCSSIEVIGVHGQLAIVYRSYRCSLAFICYRYRYILLVVANIDFPIIDNR